MIKISIRLLIRRFVLATAFPPFIGIYRLFYKLVIILATRLFRKFPEIKTVYLRRGSAKGEIIPLLSDIDFAVVTSDMEQERLDELLRNYESLAATTTLLDKSLEIYSEESFFTHFESGSYFQYRFIEGKKTWKLIYGKDYLSELPDLPIGMLYGGLHTEVKIWWTIFEWRFLQNRKYSNEFVTINNTCYKAVSEILKMNLALNTGTLMFSRKKAFELSRPEFSGKELQFIEKLEKIAVKNYRTHDPNVLEETKNFLMIYLDNFYRESHNHPFIKPIKEKTQKVFSLREELLVTESDQVHINHLVEYVMTKWINSFRGCYLLSGIYFNVDELLFIVKINPHKIPSTDELTQFNLFHKQAPPASKSRIKLFLLLSDTAFQIDTEDFKMSWQSVLNPGFNPDIFELLGRSEFKLYGESSKKYQITVWNQPVEHFLCQEQKLFFELLENPSIYKLNNLDFLRIFWKTVQLVIVNRTAKEKEIIYPLTLQSIEKTLIQQKLPLPQNLKNLSDSYRKELSGISEDISSEIPAAINYLKGLENE